MPSPLRAAPRAWLSLTTRCLCLLESDQVRNGGPEGGHGGGCGALRGSWPGERARVHPGDSPTLSEGAMVWQRVGKGAGLPSAASLSGKPAGLGLPYLIPKNPPTCFSLLMCLRVCYVRARVPVCVHASCGFVHVCHSECVLCGCECVYMYMWRAVQACPEASSDVHYECRGLGPARFSSPPASCGWESSGISLCTYFSPSLPAPWPSPGSGFAALAQVGAGCRLTRALIGDQISFLGCPTLFWT